MSSSSEFFSSPFFMGRNGKNRGKTWRRNGQSTFFSFFFHIYYYYYTYEKFFVVIAWHIQQRRRVLSFLWFSTVLPVGKYDHFIILKEDSAFFWSTKASKSVTYWFWCTKETLRRCHFRSSDKKKHRERFSTVLPVGKKDSYHKFWIILISKQIKIASFFAALTEADVFLYHDVKPHFFRLVLPTFI